MPRTKIFISLAIAILLIAVVSLYVFYIPWKNARGQSEATTQQKTAVPPVEAIIVSVSPEKSEVVARLTSTTSETGTTEMVIQVDSNTRINNVVIQRSENGAVEKQMIEELNIDDLKKGDIVSVGSSFPAGVSGAELVTISYTTYSNINDYVAKKNSSDTHPYFYVRSRVSRVDTEKSILTFNVFNFGGLSTTTQQLSLDNNLPIYHIDEVSMLTTVHARTRGTMQDIQPGTTVYFIVDKDGFDGTIRSARGIIISKK